MNEPLGWWQLYQGFTYLQSFSDKKTEPKTAFFYGFSLETPKKQALEIYVVWKMVALNPVRLL